MPGVKRADTGRCAQRVAFAMIATGLLVCANVTAAPFAAPVRAGEGGANAAQAAKTPKASADATAVWRLWGTREIRSTRLSAFAKWNGMLDRYRREQARLAARVAVRCKDDRTAADAARRSGVPRDRSFAALVALARAKRARATAGEHAAPASSASLPACARAHWERFLASLEGLSAREKLARVNAHLNRAPYIIDPINWGVADYWATPIEFLRKDGDCEDYAIAKYLALKQLGFDPATMRVVVLEDRNLKVDHAVLAVRLDGRLYILDNQTPRVVEASRIRHYRPVYSINEQAWWLHSGWRPTNPSAGGLRPRVWTASR